VPNANFFDLTAMPATLSQNPHSNVSEASYAPEETSRGDPNGIVNLTRGHSTRRNIQRKIASEQQ
jgi:hypothetical protein